MNFRFDGLYIENPAQLGEQHRAAATEANKRGAEIVSGKKQEESVRIMVEAATASSSSVIVSDVMHRDNSIILSFRQYV